MKNEKFTIEKESLLAIKQGNELRAVIFSSPGCRHKVFYACMEMGVDEIETVLKDIAMALKA